jgi:phage pi2 protein 07
MTIEDQINHPTLFTKWLIQRYWTYYTESTIGEKWKERQKEKGGVLDMQEYTLEQLYQKYLTEENQIK